MLTLSYKGFCLVRRGSRIAVAKDDGDTLGTFPGWTAAFTFIDGIKPGTAVPVIKEWEDARDRALHG